MTSRVVILMPSIDKNAFGVRELLIRQDFYCSQLRALKGGRFQRPLLIVSGSEAPQEEFQNMEVCVTASGNTSILSFVLKAWKVLRARNINVESYVAGTPFQPFLAALLLQVFYSRSPIHTAIHGEISALKTGGVLSRIKYLFLKTFISKASSLRFVSEKQLIGARKLLPVSKTQAFITPIPVLRTTEFQRVVSPQTIAFVGRLQSERGVQDWIEIAKHFDERRLVIIGDGPLLPMAKSALPHAKFLGHLENSKVQEVWPEIGVLLSTAQFESYGLAMREALLHGVPVVSRRNAGSLELHEQWPRLIQLFANDKEAAEKIKMLLAHSPSLDDFVQFRNHFFDSQTKSLLTLARAWSNEF